MRNDRPVAFVVSSLTEGLLLVDGDSVEHLDRIPTTGLADGPHGVARAVHDPAETATDGWILFSGGAERRVPGLADAHELAWSGDLLGCVSTLENAVLWADRRGRVVRRWQAPGRGDCWHLNGLTTVGTGALATAFGRFPSHRDWAESDRDGAGVVVELPGGRIVASGLSCPHSPRLVGGRLAVCDSGRGELVVGDRRIGLGGWTRGLAVTESELVVGVSAARAAAGRAHLAVLRRSDLRVARRIRLPVREVFGVLELSPARARALARPGPSPARTTPLRPADLRVAIEPPPPLRLEPGALATVTCTVTNLGSARLASTPPHPVALVASWSSAGRALWSPLARPLGPGERRAVRARLLAPTEPGAHVLELRLVQEAVAWLEGVALVEVMVG
jgi:hypothetical protein